MEVKELLDRMNQVLFDSLIGSLENLMEFPGENMLNSEVASLESVLVYVRRVIGEDCTHHIETTCQIVNATIEGLNEVCQYDEGAIIEFCETKLETLNG